MNQLKNLIKYFSPSYQKLILEYKVNLRPRSWQGNNPHFFLFQIINKRRDIYSNMLLQFKGYQSIFHDIKKTADENDLHAPAWNNGFLPGLDIISLYSLIRIKKPAHFIEIGSGNSTKVAFKAINDEKLSTQITSIDPNPRAMIDKLATRIIRQPVEEIDDFSMFSDLQPNDIVFIDNSHRCLPNSDVTVCFLEILPLLKPGVIIHFHDIYLPYDYPQFMCDRFYSEQYLLASILLSNPMKYRPIIPCFFISEDPELSIILNDIWQHPNLKDVEKHGGSFWIEIA